MTAVATLRTPSEGLLALLFPSPRRVRELLKQAEAQRGFWSTLLEDPLVRRELERLANAIKELARPLAHAQSADELEQSLNAQIHPYLLWKSELFALILRSLRESDPEDFLNEYRNAIQRIQGFFHEKASRHLDPENAERLESALYGVCLYSENLMRTIFEEGPESVNIDAVKATTESFIKADLLILTAALMLNRELRGWQKPTLVLIAQQAEAHVDAIEDELIARDLELRKLLEHPSGLSSTLDEYSRQQGLS